MVCVLIFAVVEVGDAKKLSDRLMILSDQFLSADSDSIIGPALDERFHSIGHRMPTEPVILRHPVFRARGEHEAKKERDEYERFHVMPNG